MTQVVGRFKAIAADGTEFTIAQLVWYVLLRPADGPPELLREGPYLWTTAGQEVEEVGPGTYQVVATGLLLRSSEPAAA